MGGTVKGSAGGAERVGVGWGGGCPIKCCFTVHCCRCCSCCLAAAFVAAYLRCAVPLRVSGEDGAIRAMKCRASERAREKQEVLLHPSTLGVMGWEGWWCWW